MRLKDRNSVGKFMKAVSKCKGGVYLVSLTDDTRINLNSELSLYLGVGHLLDDFGDNFSLTTEDPADYNKLMDYFVGPKGV